MSDMIGRTLGRYEIVEEIGSGGMARVFLARDNRLERNVALKVLHPHLGSRPENRSRIEREARGLAKLQHENIIEVYDYSGPQSEDCYIVTEFIEGTTLKVFIGQNPLQLPEVAAMIALEIAYALDTAHSEGIIHRDVKPENIMVSNEGSVKLMDFGIAQVLDQEGMTMTGHLIGSPAFMSPEQACGEKVDQRSDIFSLGLVMFWMTTGRMPFEVTNTPAVIRAVSEGNFESPQIYNPQISNRFSRLIDRTLATAKEERPQSAAELIDELMVVLEETGLVDYRTILRHFLTTPREAEVRIRETIVENLLIGAQSALNQRKYGAALDKLNRLLILDPDNPTAQNLIEKISSTGARRRSLMIAVMVLLIGAIGYAGTMIYLQRSAAKKDVKQALALPVPEAGVTVLASGQRYVPTDESPEVSAPQIDHVAPVSKNGRNGNNNSTRINRVESVSPPPLITSQPKFGRLHLHINPHGKVYIDGREFSRESKIDHEFRLTVGEHDLVVSSQYHRDHRESLRIPRKGALVNRRIRLEELPSYIKVTAPENAIIFIDGRDVGRGPLLTTSVGRGMHLVTIRIGEQTRGPQRIEAVPGQIRTVAFTVFE
jgi:eukaryotic-like serine/threonine-protein kinase